MLAELRAKSQVTIPKEVVARLGIKEGDKLEITEKDGVIQLILQKFIGYKLRKKRVKCSFPRA